MSSFKFHYTTKFGGANLTGANFTGTDIENVRGLDTAKLCKTIMPWGEDNSGC